MRGRRRDPRRADRVARKRAGQWGPGFATRSPSRSSCSIDAAEAKLGCLLDGGSTGDGLPYLVMEYIEGLAEDAHLIRQEVERKLAEIGKQISDGPLR